MSASRLSFYLTATRMGRRGLLGADSAAYYAPLIKFCRATIKPPAGGHPKVALVYTLSRRSELVNLSGVPVLIHDQHLGQTLATCLRVLNLAPEPEAKARFFTRVLAEESLSVGDAAGAAAGYLASAKLDRAWAGVPKSFTKPQVLIEGMLQELFILAHEYSHLLMSASPEFESSRRQIAEMLIEARQDERDPIEAYAEFEARYPGVEDFEVFRTNLRRQRQFFSDHADKLRIETACDDFALAVLLHHSKTTGLPARHAFRAAFLALRHMRAIHYVRECVNSVKARGDVGGAEAIRLLQGREQALRGVFALAAEACGVTSQLDDFWDELADLADQQDREVDYPLLMDIIPGFAKARNRTARNKRWSSRDVLVIASSQDWAAQSNALEHILM